MRWSLLVAGLVVVVVGCAEGADPASCRTMPRVATAPAVSTGAEAPFRLPLDVVEAPPHDADFQESGRTESGFQFHAAEDYWAPAGTPVYAMADGEVSFSGPMGGYGWLVIVDHSQANLYSLYGHLSPSRWSTDRGPVIKGDLIGYLGDGWENGGSYEEPLGEHLHLGVRAGLRTDYPGRGEWRWMAGWIGPCPTELGWLQPSALIADQEIPSDGFAAPGGSPVDKWGLEVLVVAVAVIAPVWWIASGLRSGNWIGPLAAGAVVLGVARFLTHRGFVLMWIPSLVAITALVAGGLILYRRIRNRTGPP